MLAVLKHLCFFDVLPTASQCAVHHLAAMTIALDCPVSFSSAKPIVCQVSFRLVALRCPNPGRGSKRKTWDFSRLMKVTASGNQESNNKTRKPFTKEDWIKWHEVEAPSWKSALAFTSAGVFSVLLYFDFVWQLTVVFFFWLTDWLTDLIWLFCTVELSRVFSAGVIYCWIC